MSDSARQLALINARFAELMPLLSGSPEEPISELPPRFDEVRTLLQQARTLTSSGRLLPPANDHTREILADYRRHLISIRNAMGRMEPLLTARRAELHRQLDHIRHATFWAASVRTAR